MEVKTDKVSHLLAFQINNTKDFTLHNLPAIVSPGLDDLIVEHFTCYCFRFLGHHTTFLSILEYYFGLPASPGETSRRKSNSPFPLSLMGISTSRPAILNEPVKKK